MSYQFYNTICGLRQKEEIVLYDRMLVFTPEDEQLTTDFLHAEYDSESVNFPFIAPPFDPTAALWAAKTTYTVGQLVLYREHDETAFRQLLPAYNGTVSAASILSADLCLRFMPELAEAVKRIDPDDALLQLLEEQMRQWHYSAIGYPTDPALLSMDAITENECLLQLYADRVIEKRDLKRALLPGLLKTIKASLGIYTPVFWKELNTAIEDE